MSSCPPSRSQISKYKNNSSNRKIPLLPPIAKRQKKNHKQQKKQQTTTAAQSSTCNYSKKIPKRVTGHRLEPELWNTFIINKEGKAFNTICDQMYEKTKSCGILLTLSSMNETGILIGDKRITQIIGNDKLQQFNVRHSPELIAILEQNAERQKQEIIKATERQKEKQNKLIIEQKKRKEKQQILLQQYEALKRQEFDKNRNHKRLNNPYNIRCQQQPLTEPTVNKRNDNGKAMTTKKQINNQEYLNYNHMDNSSLLRKYVKITDSTVNLKYLQVYDYKRKQLAHYSNILQQNKQYFVNQKQIIMTETDTEKKTRLTEELRKIYNNKAIELRPIKKYVVSIKKEITIIKHRINEYSQSQSK